MFARSAIGSAGLHEADGVVQFGMELSGDSYLLINRVPVDDEIGDHHYIEIGDQSGGAYDAVQSLALSPDHRALDIQMRSGRLADYANVRIEMPVSLDEASVAWLNEFMETLPGVSATT